jgi:hypothetical protein
MKNTTLFLNILVLGSGFAITACNGGGGGGSSTPQSQAKALPSGYQCNPANYPSNSTPNSLQIAYAANCSVESAAQSANLQKLAVALEYYRAESQQFGRYCTGTPIYQNPTTGVYFIVTAAHCVIGTTAQKAAGVAITASNVSTYDLSNGHNSAWIYQGTNPLVTESSNLNGQIMAVYVNSQYCQAPAFALDTTSGTYECPNDQLAQMNGDVAVVKVQTQPGKTISIAPNVKLAPSNFYMTPTSSSGSNLLVLGYGGTNTNGTISGQNLDNNYLNYIATQYFGTNSYGGTTAAATIFNGFYNNGMFYTLICGGDSGGGDFAWDGSYWNLVGIHSWGNTDLPAGIKCGAYATNDYMINASADVRQLNGWIQTVLNQDNQATGCASLGSQYVCTSGSGQ